MVINCMTQNGFHFIAMVIAATHTPLHHIQIQANGFEMGGKYVEVNIGTDVK